MELQNLMRRIKTDKAPQAIGTYSQGTIAGNLIFTSGQIAINPDSGSVIVDNFECEVLQVLNNIEAILIKAGSCKKNIVKLTVFMTDLSQFEEVNLAFKYFFDTEDNFPSRSTVEVSKLPMGVNVEIEAVGIIS